MRILIWHGYLLRGTGSNIYVANLARALVKQGHDVVVMCQDPRAGDLDFVDRFVAARAGRYSEKPAIHPGSCAVIQPDIGDLLAVYVLDDYEGFSTVKTMVSMSEAEIATYIERNVDAVREVAAEYSPDVVLTNHAVCSPAILSRAATEVPYFSYIHGSALEYAVKKDPRFYDLAVEGLDGAEGVLAGSSYQREEVLRLFSAQIGTLDGKLTLMPCGVDVDAFKIGLDYDTACSNLAPTLAGVELDRCLRPALHDALEREAVLCDAERIAALTRQVQHTYDYSLPEAPFASEGLDFNRDIRARDTTRIYFLGKLIPAKGFQDLVVAFAELVAAGEDASLTVTAFGKYREHFELLLRALSAGEREVVDKVLSLDDHFEEARRYYAAQGDDYFAEVRAADPRSRVFFTGRLGHDEIANVLPHMDLIVTPSRVPEAFGMVAIEGMACGVLSAMTYFSGLVDVADTAGRYLDAETAELIRIDRDHVLDDLRRKLPLLARRARSLTDDDRLALRRAVVENFTWNSVAEGFLERAQAGLASSP